MSKIIDDWKKFLALSELERGMLVKAFFKANAAKIEELQQAYAGQHVVVDKDFEVIATFIKDHDGLAEKCADSYGETENRVVFVLPADRNPNLML